MHIPNSKHFTDLAWDLDMPAYPSLNGAWKMPSGEMVEVSLVGDEAMKITWERFIQYADSTSSQLVSLLNPVLHNALPKISALHRAYFGDRWSGDAEGLLAELKLRLVCFYPEGSCHLWLAGSAVFNRLDVDIELDEELRLGEVRFDG